MTDTTLTSKEINDPLLVKALRDLLDRYVGLVNCGDCGNWDPEKEGEVAQARAALRLANVAPYMNSPIECGHRLARLVCPDCGIDLRGNVLNTSETEAVDYVQFGWIPYHEKQGADPNSFEEHEENCGFIVEGWRWVPAFAGMKANSTLLQHTNECACMTRGLACDCGAAVRRQQENAQKALEEQS